MKKYAKGARREREIIHYLLEKGWSAMRGAGSKMYLSEGKKTKIDIIAFKGDRILLIDAKTFYESKNGVETKLMTMKEEGFEGHYFAKPLVLREEWKRELGENI